MTTMNTFVLKNSDAVCAADCNVNISSTLIDSINALKCNIPIFNAKKLSNHIAGVIINVTL